MTKLRKKSCNVYNKNFALSAPVCQRWFVKFHSGDFNIKDAPRSARPMAVDNDKVKALVDANHRYTTRNVAEIPNVSKSSVENHLKALGYASKLDVWTPHRLVVGQVHLIKRITTCDPLLKREENDPFLKLAITGDETWIVYSNIERKRLWSKRDEPAESTLRAKIHQGKVMSSIWCDWKSIVLFQGMKRLIRVCTVDSWTN